MSTPDFRVWDYRITELVRAVDGDTFDLTLEKRMDFGFRLVEDKRWTARFRLLDADTWEMNQAGGAAARGFADAWLRRAIQDDVCRGQTYKTDNFGRWLIDPYRADTYEHLSGALTRGGHTKT